MRIERANACEALRPGPGLRAVLSLPPPSLVSMQQAAGRVGGRTDHCAGGRPQTFKMQLESEASP